MKKDVKSKGERFSANNRLTIVFFAQIKTVKYMSKLLVNEGLRCVELYGSLQQADREKRLLEFKAGKILLYMVCVRISCKTKVYLILLHCTVHTHRQDTHSPRYRHSCARNSHIQCQLCRQL